MPASSEDRFRRAGAPAPARLNLPAIEARLSGLHDVVQADPHTWHTLRREGMDGDVMRRLMAGYRYVDDLLARDVDPFALGNSHHLLELNHIVLCGTSPETRAAAAKHIERTETWFYQVRAGGIGSVMEWYQRNRDDAPVDLFAGLFLQIVSTPQLFVEGNQRTAAIICSYPLARTGLAPAVVGADDYIDAFKLFAQIKVLNMAAPFGPIRAVLLQRRLARWYRATADVALLLPDGGT